MSLSTDVLAKATPTRLICRGGRWVLELTRLEAVDRDVFQPRLSRLEGADSILAALRRGDDGQHLATTAAQIMRSPRAEEDRAFEVSEGDWVPSADASPAARSPQLEGDAADLARSIAELRAELAVLRASHTRLRERVISLEATQSGNPLANSRAPRGARHPQRRRSEPPTSAAPPEQPLPVNAGFAATQASPGLAAALAQAPLPAPLAAAQAVAAADGAPSAAPAQTFEELARSLNGGEQLPVLGIPSQLGISECLEMLIGSVPQLERAAELPFAKLVGARACKLLDDEGRERGAIVLDLQAAVVLGAMLLALPKDEALRQVRENEPSEDALLAMSEICNNLTGPVNAVPGNHHVRSTVLESVDVSAFPKTRARADYTVEGGRFALAMF